MAKFTVTPKHSGLTLLAYLREVYEEAPSVKAIKRSIDNKGVTINGRVERFSTYKVRAGEVVELHLKEEKRPPAAAILYEDDALKVIDKPPGALSENPLHRLDKETSGVLVLAKSKEAFEALYLQFKERKAEKLYLAIVDGRVEEDAFQVDNFLGVKKRYSGGTIYGSVAPKLGKRAITRFKCLVKSKEATFLECQPKTGRTHQIRVHLKERGHPVLGDWQYGQTFQCPLRPERHLLHAYKLVLDHPETGERVTFKAPLPKDFLEVQKKLFPRHTFSL
ncbi:MAG: Ribosomal large subunit pseudouridine synthase C [Chlamydiae bacterium]|nr:Ribosomal large subunit pseudouridine synthase C [Chlamydiota bacterium]